VFLQCEYEEWVVAYIYNVSVHPAEAESLSFLEKFHPVLWNQVTFLGFQVITCRNWSLGFVTKILYAFTTCSALLICLDFIASLILSTIAWGLSCHLCSQLLVYGLCPSTFQKLGMFPSSGETR
jgi:hypothetical protein